MSDAVRLNPMHKYIVQWVIEVDAETPEDAAILAHEMQQEPTRAVFFSVTDEEGHTKLVDLEKTRHWADRTGERW